MNIVVFDSGLGGLTILDALRSRLPSESFIYFADHAFFPYGERANAEIQERVLKIATFFENHNAKAFVIACNTATAAAADFLREKLKMPIIAVEPAVKPAVEKSKNNVIAILATPATIKSERFLSLVKRYENGKKIILQACPNLAFAIENAKENPQALQKELESVLPPVAAQSPDVVVLGCTHYPWIKKEIAAFFAPNTLILETGDAVARQVENRLSEKIKKTGQGALTFATSGDEEKMQKQLGVLGFAGFRVENLAI